MPGQKLPADAERVETAKITADSEIAFFTKGSGNKRGGMIEVWSRKIVKGRHYPARKLAEVIEPHLAKAVISAQKRHERVQVVKAAKRR